jgi:hypothetical protein
LQSVDLSNPNSLRNYRDDLLRELPEMIGRVGFTTEAALLEQGDHQAFVEWFTGSVAIQGHGATDGFGLTREQGALFNPYASKHKLMGPVDLWLPGDELPEDVLMGEIKNYEQFPEIDKLIPAAYRAGRGFIVGALFRGMIGRIEAAVDLARMNENLLSGRGYDFVMISGQREPMKGDIAGGIYKEYFRDSDGNEAHDLALLKDEPTMAEAIIRSHLQLDDEPFEVVYDTVNQKLEESHPGLGPRTWKAKRYKGTLDGKPVTFTIMNARAVPPQGQMNRSGWKPNASDALREWMELAGSEVIMQGSVAHISYAHMLRIAAAFVRDGKAFDKQLGSMLPVGNMPLESSWDSMDKNGKHNGATLGFKEILPVIRAINRLLGLQPDDLRLYR